MGLSVDVNIIVDRAPEALTVPRQSIRDIATAPYVLTVKDGKLAKQSIAFIDWPAQSVIVTDGLKPGDQVVVSPKTPAVGAKVKVDCSRTASDLITLAMEICGGVACMDEFGLIRHQADLFVTRVGEGSNFALKDLIVRPLRQGD